jgi:hypothetical protein
MARLLLHSGLTVVRGFRRNEAAEQVDMAFHHQGWFYIVECRWRKKPACIREIDGLRGQLERSGKQTMGVFLGINGWSQSLPALLQQSQNKNTVLMDGNDLRAVLNGSIGFTDLLNAKTAALNLAGQAFLSAKAIVGS